MIIDEVVITGLLKAREKFENFRLHLNSEQEQAGAIQAFEYSYELTWKIMKRLLEKRGKIVNSPRETFREAGLEKLISNTEIWFNFIKIRNLTVHTYDEENVKKVIAIFDEFSKQLDSFISNIKA